MFSFKKALPVIATGALLAVGGFTSAQASFVIDDSINAFTFDPSFQNLNPPANLGNGGFSGAGYSVSFNNVPANQGVVNGTVTNVHAAPVLDSSGAVVTSNYFSTGLGNMVITFSKPQYSIALLWGSVDASNSINFLSGGTSVGTVLGTNITANPTGQTTYGGSFYTEITSSTAFDSIVLTSGQISFELANFEYSKNRVLPEPATIAMLGVGLLGLTFLRRSRSA